MLITVELYQVSNGKNPICICVVFMYLCKRVNGKQDDHSDDISSMHCIQHASYWFSQAKSDLFKQNLYGITIKRFWIIFNIFKNVI